MTDTQLYLAVGLPCVTVLASLVVSLFQISAVREDIREIRGDLKNIVNKLGTMDVEIGKLMDRSK